MLSKRKIILPVLGLVTAGTLILGTVGVVNAQTTGNTPLSGLAQMIAQKFNLDQNQVQTVIDQYRTQQKTHALQNVQNKRKSFLDNEVSQGKITQAQEQAILNELTALDNQYPFNKNMTPAQMKQNFQNRQNALKSWAQSQGIDLSLIPGGEKMGIMWRGRWHNAESTPAPTASPAT